MIFSENRDTLFWIMLELHLTEVGREALQAARQRIDPIERRVLERDDFSSNRHPALSFCLSMIFSENRYTLFRIMLQASSRRRMWSHFARFCRASSRRSKANDQKNARDIEPGSCRKPIFWLAIFGSTCCGRDTRAGLKLRLLSGLIKVPLSTENCFYPIG
jgi:hypothetical protein